MAPAPACIKAAWKCGGAKLRAWDTVRMHCWFSPECRFGQPGTPTASVRAALLQAICNAEHMYKTVVPVSSYAEMEAYCREEFKDEDVREDPPTPTPTPTLRFRAESSRQAEWPALPQSVQCITT